MERAFALNPVLSRLMPPVVAGLLAPPLELALALRKLEKIYNILSEASDPIDFSQKALSLTGASLRVENDDASVPQDGPLVIVANHPFGALEGLFLYQWFARQRPDLKILGNELLGRIAPLAPALIAVDVLSGHSATGRNARSLIGARRHVAGGGALLLFPAGAVSRFDAGDGGIADPVWNPVLGHLVRTTGASVLPVHVEGRNSTLFQLAGLVNPGLRTALLPRELLNKRRQRPATVRIGRPLAADDVVTAGDDASVTQTLRCLTYAIGTRPHRARIRSHRRVVPVATGVDPAILASEVSALPPEARLAASGGLEVWMAEAAQIPALLQEIGRLRESTFRAVGEGTGRARDVDLYDNYYDQLFLWNPATREVVGGYRIGRLDRIAHAFGTRRLYTHSLFRFQRPFLPSLGQAVELGRSFIRAEYQRNYAPLLLLWKGIAGFLLANPRYRTLFGPVSLSNDFTPAARAVITGYLEAKVADRRRSGWVQGRRALPTRGSMGRTRREGTRLADLTALETVVAHVDPAQGGLPVLLRQYLKLGAQVAGFNVDRAFGDAIDILVVVDMDRLDTKTLVRYMGSEGAATYRAAGPGQLSD